ncbi:MAG: polysaccharide deacetylase family protein [Bacillota bacterium]
MKPQQYFIIVMATVFFIISVSLMSVSLAEDIYPALIIVYDDGYTEDVEKALPVHEKMGVPAVSAVNPDTLGNEGIMDERDLKKLYDSGWEIASHGLYHSALTLNKVIVRAQKGDMRLRVSNATLIEDRYNYLLYNVYTGDSEEVEIAESNDEKNELKLEEKLQKDYSKEGTYVKLTQKALKKEIGDSKEKLNELGFEVRSFVYPYNGVIEEAEEIVRQNYKLARGGRKEGEDFPEAFINTPPLDYYRLKGVSFETDRLTTEDLDQLLNKTVDLQGLLILYAHTGQEGFDSERLEYILRTARILRINVITLKDLSSYLD